MPLLPDIIVEIICNRINLIGRIEQNLLGMNCICITLFFRSPVLSFSLPFLAKICKFLEDGFEKGRIFNPVLEPVADHHRKVTCTDTKCVESMRERELLFVPCVTPCVFLALAGDAGTFAATEILGLRCARIITVEVGSRIILERVDGY